MVGGDRSGECKSVRRDDCDDARKRSPNMALDVCDAHAEYSAGCGAIHRRRFGQRPAHGVYRSAAAPPSRHRIVHGRRSRRRECGYDSHSRHELFVDSLQAVAQRRVRFRTAGSRRASDRRRSLHQRRCRGDQSIVLFGCARRQLERPTDHCRCRRCVAVCFARVAARAGTACQARLIASCHRTNRYRARAADDRRERHASGSDDRNDNQ